MKRIYILLVVLILFICTEISGDEVSDSLNYENANIQFIGDPELKKIAMELLDKVLKEKGNWGVYGDLSGGILEIMEEMNIRIQEHADCYSIDIFPKSDSGGHDFCFRIDKKTGEISDAVIGEIEPPPEL